MTHVMYLLLAGLWFSGAAFGWALCRVGARKPTPRPDTTPEYTYARIGGPALTADDAEWFTKTRWDGD